MISINAGGGSGGGGAQIENFQDSRSSRVRCALTGTGVEAYNSTKTYSDSSMFQIGSADINGFLIPEEAPNAFLKDSLFYLGTASRLNLHIDNATQNSLSQRFILGNKLKAGTKIGKFHLFSDGIYASSTYCNGGMGAYGGAVANTTGTVTAKINKISDTGTITNISTAIQAHDFTSDVPFSLISNASSVALDTGDQLILDLKFEIDQNTASNYDACITMLMGAVGKGTQPGYVTYIDLFLES